MKSLLRYLFGDKKRSRELAAKAHELHRDWRPNEALAAAREALENDPNNDDALLLYAIIIGEKGDHGAALESYRKLQHLSPDEPGFWWFAGEELVELERHDEAADEYRAGLARWPDHVGLLCGLASCLWHQKKRVESRKMLETARNVRTQDLPLLKKLCIGLALHGDDQAVESELARLEALDPVQAADLRRSLAFASMLPREPR